MRIRVETLSGYRADEEPRAIHVGGRRLAILEVTRRWREPDAELFEVRAEDGRAYRLRHDLATDGWEADPVSRSG